MARIEGAGREICEATEFVAFVTQGEVGPHVVGNWGSYLRRNNRIELLMASKSVRGALVVRVEEVRTQL